MAALAAAWRRNAFVFGSVVTGAKTCVADILVQTGYEQRETIDWRRNFVFSSFGLCYLGAFQYVQYTLWFPRIFPGVGPIAVARRVAFDQIINTGMWCAPCTARSAVLGCCGCLLRAARCSQVLPALLHGAVVRDERELRRADGV